MATLCLPSIAKGTEVVIEKYPDIFVRFRPNSDLIGRISRRSPVYSSDPSHSRQSPVYTSDPSHSCQSPVYSSDPSHSRQSPVYSSDPSHSRQSPVYSSDPSHSRQSPVYSSPQYIAVILHILVGPQYTAVTLHIPVGPQYIAVTLHIPVGPQYTAVTLHIPVSPQYTAVTLHIPVMTNHCHYRMSRQSVQMETRWFTRTDITRHKHFSRPYESAQKSSTGGSSAEDLNALKWWISSRQYTVFNWKISISIYRHAGDRYSPLRYAYYGRKIDFSHFAAECHTMEIGFPLRYGMQWGGD